MGIFCDHQHSGRLNTKSRTEAALVAAKHQERNQEQKAQLSGNELQTNQPSSNRKDQFSRFIMFAILTILINLCSFQSDFYGTKRDDQLTSRTTRFNQADGLVLGRMVKVWYIKKKIKKLSRKLRKHTIAIPVYTTMPVYEHSYYPQSHVAQSEIHSFPVSPYPPTMATTQPAASSSGSPAVTSHQLMMTSASDLHQRATAYEMTPHDDPDAGVYCQSANGPHEIKAYTPLPFHDYGSGNLYGQYSATGGYNAW